MGIKTVLKGNKYVYFIIKKVRKVQYTYLPIAIDRCNFIVKKTLRISGLHKNSLYEKLKLIKNKHQGERCFIIATGPSLKITDLEKLSEETTFSMNSICLAFEKTDWRPTYYGIQDVGVYGRLKDYIDKLNVEGKFISDFILKHCEIKDLERNYIFPINFLHHTIPNNTDYSTKFSKDAFAEIYNGHTITYSLIQIAVYMGFKEIYLLGADCTYGNDMKHHFIDYDLVDPTFRQAHDMMIASYKTAKTFADKHNINIYNATRGGKLEVFERVNLEEVIDRQHEYAIDK